MQIASDIHLEFYRKLDIIVGELISESNGAKYLALAGDIAVGSPKHGQLRSFLSKLVKGPWEKIFYVPGNHEYYSKKLTMNQINESLTKICQEYGVEFLNRKIIELPEIILLGTTLWGDLDLQKEDKLTMGLSDFTSILTQSYKFVDNIKVQRERHLSFKGYMKLHSEEISWLTSELANLTECSKPIWVITHHPPILTHNNDHLSSAYNGKAEHLFKYVNTWIFGHIHQHFESEIDGCLLVCNPRGYSDQLGYTGYIDGFQVEID